MSIIEKLNTLLDELFPNGKVNVKPNIIKLDLITECEKNDRLYSNLGNLDHVPIPGTLVEFQNGTSNEKFISNPLIGYFLASKIEDNKTLLIKIILEVINKELIVANMRNVKITEDNVKVEHFVDIENAAAYSFKITVN